MKGYKVFNEDWTCRDYQFEVGKIYEHQGAPKCCNNGFHFCVNLVDCFNYYKFNPNNKVAEVEAIGVIDYDNDYKCCTNKIHIVKELTWGEVLGKVNTGNGNSGYRNSGDRNSGDWNSGHYNSGNRNSGNGNSGDWNSGNGNSGNGNSGDWNKSNYNSGCFNTEEHRLMFFDKQTDMTYIQWRASAACGLLSQIEFNPTVWVESRNMTTAEKERYPSHETTGGYLKKLDNEDCNTIWWNKLDDREKEIIKSIPNFDADKFYIITGIKVN